jgi:Asp-tRNA(Asn)/Glu-tRNA(Gln) amidotransferase A subunit family amidase
VQLNCALQFFPEVALARAKELDDIFQKTGKQIRPLHGLPISLNDQFRIKASSLAVYCLKMLSRERRAWKREWDMSPGS